MLEDLRNICLNYWHTPPNKILNYAANQTASDLLQIEVQVEEELKKSREGQVQQEENIKQQKFILELVRLIRFSLAKLFHIYQPFTLTTREEADETDTINIDDLTIKFGINETNNLLKYRKKVRRNPEYADNLMRIDQFILDDYIKEDILKIEKKSLRQYFRKRLVTWIQQYAEQKLEEVNAEEPEQITCRICDKQFLVDCVSQHTSNCQESAELRRQIIELDQSIKQTCEEALKIQQKYNTQKHLQRKRKATEIFKQRRDQGDSPQSRGQDGSSSRSSQNSHETLSFSGAFSSSLNNNDFQTKIQFVLPTFDEQRNIIKPSALTVDKFGSKIRRKSSFHIPQIVRNQEQPVKEKKCLSEDGSDSESNQDTHYTKDLGKNSYMAGSYVESSSPLIEFDFGDELVRQRSSNQAEEIKNTHPPVDNNFDFEQKAEDEKFEEQKNGSTHLSVSLDQPISQKNSNSSSPDCRVQKEQHQKSGILRSMLSDIVEENPDPLKKNMTSVNKYSSFESSPKGNVEEIIAKEPIQNTIKFGIQKEEEEILTNSCSVKSRSNLQSHETNSQLDKSAIAVKMNHEIAKENISSNIFENDQNIQFLKDRLNSIIQLEKKQPQISKEEFTVENYSIFSSTDSLNSSPLPPSLNDSSSLSRASSYDIEEKIQEEESNIIEGLNKRKSIENRLSELEKKMYSTHQALIQSRCNSLDNSFIYEAQKIQCVHEENIDSFNLLKGQETSKVQNIPISLQHVHHGIITNSKLSKSTSKFGQLKRAQTLMLKEDHFSVESPRNDDKNNNRGRQQSIQQVISSKNLKYINQALELVISYGKRISKRIEIIALDQDLKTQNNLKFSLPQIMREEDVFSNLKKMIQQLSVINFNYFGIHTPLINLQDRISLEIKIQKLSEADDKLISDQSELLFSKEKLKKRLFDLGEFNLDEENSPYLLTNPSQRRILNQESGINRSSEFKKKQQNLEIQMSRCTSIDNLPLSHSISNEKRSIPSLESDKFENENITNSQIIKEEEEEEVEEDKISYNNSKENNSILQIHFKSSGFNNNNKNTKEDNDSSEVDSSEEEEVCDEMQHSPNVKRDNRRDSIKHIRSPSMFLKSPLSFNFSSTVGEEMDPLTGNNYVLDSLKNKGSSQFIKGSNFSKKKRRSRIESKNILLKNTNKKPKILSSSMNSVQEIKSPSYSKSTRKLNNDSKVKEIKLDIGYKADDALESAMERYNELKRQKDENLNIKFDQGSSDSSSSGEESSDQRAYYSDTDARYFSQDNVTFNQQGVSLNDFDFKRLLGVGAFGAVWLVTKKTTKDQYALKIIDCSQQMDMNQQENLRAETNVFAILKGDHVVKALYSFQFEDYLCFVLDYMNGGDFGEILRNYGRLDESIVRFYAAEIILAIEYLHSQGIIHRDLKPENVLLDTKGHIKLADFGLSEVGLTNKLTRNTEDAAEKRMKRYEALKIDLGIETESSNYPSPSIQVVQYSEKEWAAASMKPVVQKKNRVVGTPDYIPPEVVNGESIKNPSIDWWSLGVIIYEFITGIPPFNDNSVEEIFCNIKKGHIEWPNVGYEEDEMTPEAQDLIQKLLISDYTKRLGDKSVEDIKNHPFFKGIQWNTIKKQDAPLVSMITQDNQEVVSESENYLKKKEQEKIKLQNMLTRYDAPRRSSSYFTGMRNLWRVDLLASINMEEAEKLKTEAILKETKQNDKMKKLYRMASTLVDPS